LDSCQPKGNTKEWIQTYEGRKLDLLDLDSLIITIEEIAHVLSMKCRFNGHCQSFYSIAEHSIHISDLCPNNCREWGLLHDASEAYLPDLQTPLKRLPEFEWFVKLEKELLLRIAKHFYLPPTIPGRVKELDTYMLHVEKNQLMKPMQDPRDEWGSSVMHPSFVEKPIAKGLQLLTPHQAKRKFKARAKELSLS